MKAMVTDSTITGNKKPKIIVAIPAFNEEHSVGNVVVNAKKYASQVIVVDDGSTDGTSEAAVKSGAQVLRHEINQGYGISIKDCFKNARSNDDDILVTIDGDGQHDPLEIPKLLDPILKGEAGLVIGSRFLKSSQNHLIFRQGEIPGYRKFGIRFITGLLNIGSKIKVTDAQSGFRAYSKNVFNNITLSEQGMAVSIEILIKAQNKGIVFKEVPISCSYELNSHSLNPLHHGFMVAMSVIKLRFKGLLGS